MHGDCPWRGGKRTLLDDQVHGLEQHGVVRVVLVDALGYLRVRDDLHQDLRQPAAVRRFGRHWKALQQAQQLDLHHTGITTPPATVTTAPAHSTSLRTRSPYTTLTCSHGLAVE